MISTKYPNSSYMIYSDGRVQNIVTGKFKKTKVDKKGYESIDVYVGGKMIYTTVHILVARTFIANPDNKKQVNHIDGNKLNNRVDNLEWTTPAENVAHAVKTGLIRGSGGKHLKKEDWDNILALRHKGVSAEKLALQYNVTIGTITKNAKIDESNHNYIEAKNKRDREKALLGNVSKEILQFTKQGVFVKKHDSINKACKDSGVNNRDMSKVCVGIRKSAGGYIWKYGELTGEELLINSITKQGE